MTKINREEYDILKGLEDIWKWISRDDDTTLWVCENEPIKYGHCWEDLGVVCERVDSDLFQFIQWEDEEPCNIQELIEEYEREEVEMKNLESDYDKVIDELTRYVDEPEEYVIIEKPVITQLVADYIEKCKGWNDDEEFYDEDNAIDLFGAMDLDNAGMSDKVHDYLVDNQETFARAWLDGYTVEEQKYYLKIGNLYLAEPLGDMTSDIVRMTRDKGIAYQFTDEKSIATHLDKFEGTEAVKVEETE